MPNTPFLDFPGRRLIRKTRNACNKHSSQSTTSQTQRRKRSASTWSTTVSPDCDYDRPRRLYLPIIVHCLEVLRMGATCRGDVSIITHMWTDINALPIVNQNAPHQCIDFDKVMEYSKDNTVDVYQENYIVHPKFGSCAAFAYRGANTNEVTRTFFPAWTQHKTIQGTGEARIESYNEMVQKTRNFTSADGFTMSRVTQAYYDGWDNSRRNVSASCYASMSSARITQTGKEERLRGWPWKRGVAGGTSTYIPACNPVLVVRETPTLIHTVQNHSMAIMIPSRYL